MVSRLWLANPARSSPSAALPRVLLAVATATLSLQAIPERSWAAALADVHIHPSSGLIASIGYAPNLRGNFYQTATVRGEDLLVDLTLQLPREPLAGDPGPVVVLWQFEVVVADASFGDTSGMLLGAPRAEALMPNCDGDGNCAVRVRMRTPIAPGLEAADLDWAGRTGIAPKVNIVRTYENARLGDRWQMVIPGVADHGGGTLASPDPTWGLLDITPHFPPDTAEPVEIPGEFFHRGRDDLFDWAAAVREALQSIDPLATPDFVPIAAPTPEPSDTLRVEVSVDVGEECPEGQFLALHDTLCRTVALRRSLNGVRHIFADLVVLRASTWVIGVYGPDGEPVRETARQSYPDLVPGVRISGSVRCGASKGGFEQEALAVVIPNPSGAPEQTPRPAAANMTDPPSLNGGSLAAVGGGLVAAALVIIAVVWYRTSRAARRERWNSRD